MTREAVTALRTRLLALRADALDARPAHRAVVAGDGGAIRLTVHAGAGSAAAAELEPARVVRLRRAMDDAGRRWVAAAIADGRLTAAELREPRPSASATAAPAAAERRPEVPQGHRRAKPETPVDLAPPVQISIPVTRSGVAQLADLGWISTDWRDRDVAEGIVDLCNAAIDAGIRPTDNVHYIRVKRGSQSQSQFEPLRACPPVI